MAHIWMEHAEHRGRAQLPDMPYWRNLGWAPCDGPPPEADLTREPEPPTAPDGQPEQTTETPESPGSRAFQPEPQEKE